MGGHDPESGRSVRGKKKFFLLSVDNSSLFTEPTDVRSLLYSQSTPLVQALSDLGNSCVPEYTASVEFYESRNWVHKWSTIYTYIYLFIYFYRDIYFRKSTRNPNSKTVRKPQCLCYRPAVFFCRLRLTALSFPQGNIWRVLIMLL
jgi:hypothetical protein